MYLYFSQGGWKVRSLSPRWETIFSIGTLYEIFETCCISCQMLPLPSSLAYLYSGFSQRGGVCIWHYRVLCIWVLQGLGVLMSIVKFDEPCIIVSPTVVRNINKYILIIEHQNIVQSTWLLTPRIALPN